MRRVVRILLALVAGSVAAAGCGGDAESSADGGRVDRAFVAEMVPHHLLAVEMAESARERGESPFVKQLAGDIIRTQQREIAAMRSEDRTLAADGVKRGSLGVSEAMMGMDGGAAELRSADPFDRAFLEMMIPHHEGAVEMAKAELAKGSAPGLRRLAQRMIDVQMREIAAMRTKLGASS